MSEHTEFATPMMKQYLSIKKNYPDSILFFRMGDFYEMFLEDAEIGSQVLGITLTARSKGQDGKIPMAGVPYHAAESYINKLINNGHKVAICEQITDPKDSKGIVERDVIRVVTPSTNLTSDHEHEQYLLSFHTLKNKIGICFIGIANGEVMLAEEALPTNHTFNDVIEILNEYIARFQPVEILLNEEAYDDPTVLRNFHYQGVSPFMYNPSTSKPDVAAEHITNLFQVEDLEGFGIQLFQPALLACKTALDYISETQRTELAFLQHPKSILSQSHMNLNRQTIQNLELLTTVRSGEQKLSLFNTLNKTCTPIGARKLRSWLLRPLLDLNQINLRLDSVESLVNEPSRKEEIRTQLQHVIDIEKSLSRLAFGVGNARDLVAIKQGLIAGHAIGTNLPESIQNGYIENLLKDIDWDNTNQIVDYLEQSIKQDPVTTLTEGNIVAEGFNEDLDRIRGIAQGGQQLLKDIEAREQQTLGISSLKIGFNKVFGYYIEISKANSDRAPDHYIRKQTLTNAERYIIPELKDHEEQVLDAQDKGNQLEFELFQQITSTILEKSDQIQKVAQLLATIDVLQSLAQVAVDNNYARPKVNQSEKLEIQDGRHPVVEQTLESSFVPNSIAMNLEGQNRFAVLTGANMAGKSTFIRQLAVITIMAQVGSFVPASKAEIGLVDQIHTRIGAMDDLSAGLSTFMVEMLETAKILNNLTDRSLVILDEIGRGTSTYDGVAIAWAVSEHIIKETQAKTLFATHFHELTQLEQKYKEASNFHMSVKENKDSLNFLYLVKPGAADESYGIEVAKKAGLPDSVTDRASNILSELRSSNENKIKKQEVQLSLFE